MATTQQEKDYAKADILGATAGFAGAVGVAHAMYGDKKLGDMLDAAQDRRDTARRGLDVKLDDLKNSAVLSSKQEAKRSAYERAHLDYLDAVDRNPKPDALEKRWIAAIDELTPTNRQLNVHIKAKQAGLRHLETLSVEPGSTHAIKLAKAEIAALEDIKKSRSLPVDPAGAAGHIEIKLTAARAGVGAEPPEYADFLENHNARHKKAIINKYADLEPKAAAKINKITRPQQRDLNNAERSLRNAEGKLTDALKTEVKDEVSEIRAASKELKGLERIETMNAKSGIYNALKRPFVLLKEGDGKTKLGILATGVVLGTLAYVGTRTAQELSKQRSSSASFQEREQMRAAQMQMAAAAADPRAV